MEIKIGRGKDQLIVRAGDVQAIAAGTKLVSQLKAKPNVSYWDTKNMASTKSRYEQLVILCNKLFQKTQELKHVPAELASTLVEARVARVATFYQLDADYFLSKHRWVHPAELSDGFDGRFLRFDANSDVRHNLERKYTPEVINHLKKMPQIQALYSEAIQHGFSMSVDLLTKPLCDPAEFGPDGRRIE